jgi:hypothetical protein
MPCLALTVEARTQRLTAVVCGSQFVPACYVTTNLNALRLPTLMARSVQCFTETMSAPGSCTLTQRTKSTAE